MSFNSKMDKIYYSLFFVAKNMKKFLNGAHKKCVVEEGKEKDDERKDTFRHSTCTFTIPGSFFARRL